MPLPPYLLADSDGDLMKVVIGVIIAIIWGIGALANMAKKQQGQEERSRAEMERAMRAQVEVARRNQAAAEALARGQVNAPNLPPPPPPGYPPGFQFPQQQQQPQRPHVGPMVPPMRPRAQPQRPAGQRNVPPPVLQRPVQQAGRPRGPVMPAKRTKKAERRQPQRPAPEPVLEELSSYSEGPTRPGVTESEIGAGTAPASPSRRLAAVRPMVRLTPQSLRQQFILTEILQPPLSLREPR